MFAPVYAQFAEAYHGSATFVTVVGDKTPENTALMKRLGIKSVPHFIFYRGGQQVASFAGANKQGFRNQLTAAGVQL